MINAAVLKAYMAARPGVVTFTRPGNALALVPNARIFTLPHFPEIALMEVGSVDELVDIGHGFALMDSAGHNMWGYVGVTAAYVSASLDRMPVTIQSKLGLSNSGGRAWSKVNANVGKVRFTPNHPPIRLRAYQTQNSSTVIYNGSSQPGILLDLTEAPVSFDAINNPNGGFICARVVGAGSEYIPPFAASQPLTRMFAVLNKAEAGHVRAAHGVDGASIGHGIKMGWMTDRVSFGTMHAPMDKITQQILAEPMDSKLRDCLPTAFKRMVDSGQFDYEPKWGMTTYFGGNNGARYGDVAPDFGLALTNPSRVGSGPSYENVMSGEEPTAVEPIGIPDLLIHSARNCPSELQRGIYTWHALGLAIQPDTSISPLSAPQPTLSFEDYTRVKGIIEHVPTKLDILVAAGVPTQDSMPVGTTVAQGFNPALSQDDAMDEVIKLYNNGGIICGDAYWSYRQKVKSLYSEWEKVVHEKYS